MSKSVDGRLVFLDKIRKRKPLSDGAERAFLDLPTVQERYATYHDVVREGESTNHCCLVNDGFVSRYKTLANGGRQINSFHVTGDLVDLQSALLLSADHAIRTHKPTTIIKFNADDILELASRFPEWSRAFWYDTLIDGSIFREWTLNVGRRTAVERIAHILLELAWRLHSIGEGDGNTFTMPVTQADLADAAGLSPVHTNRSLQTLRATGLIRAYGKTVEIENRDALVAIAGFDPTYLHPEGPRR